MSDRDVYIKAKGQIQEGCDDKSFQDYLQKKKQRALKEFNEAE